MKILYEKIPKNMIPLMPRIVFNGRIIVVQSQIEAEKAITYLESKDITGIDTETKPTFKKGESHKVALLQVATDDICFLFRLNYIGMPDCIIRFLSNKEIAKIGLSLHDDISRLKSLKDFTPKRFIDLQKIAQDICLTDMSLQKLYANIFHERISKSQQLSNWEADVLSDGQKLYAATDAWACYNLYKEMNTLKRNKEYILISETPQSIQ